MWWVWLMIWVWVLGIQIWTVMVWQRNSCGSGYCTGWNLCGTRGDCDDSIESGLLAFQDKKKCDQLDNDCDGEVDGIGTIFFLMVMRWIWLRRCCSTILFLSWILCSTLRELRWFWDGGFTLCTWICNGVDDNCDGLIDDPSSFDAPTWYQDSDGDGYGPEQNALLSWCTGRFVSNLGDCDD